MTYLYLKKGYKFRDLFKLSISKKEIKKHFYIFLTTVIIMFLSVLLFDRENLLNLPLANPKLFLVFSITYPLFSAFGQEIIYRLFLFERYKEVFVKEYVLVLLSALVFSFVHIVYLSYLSLILTFIFGLYAALVYKSSRSVFLTSILHGLYGNYVFFIGLGGYFWLDMYKWLS